MELTLENRFTYHPPKTEERIRKHETINQSSLALARAVYHKQSYCARQRALVAFYSAVLDNVRDEESLSWATEELNRLWEILRDHGGDHLEGSRFTRFLRTVQTARMAANQGITIDEIAHADA